jgi:hypothetical protein
MRRRRPEYSCTIVIPLNKNSVLEIGTSATHAFEIISGETVLPAQKAKVFDTDGNPLTKEDLLQLRDSEK